MALPLIRYHDERSHYYKQHIAFDLLNNYLSILKRVHEYHNDIVSMLMEEVPVFALRMMELRGEQPHMQFVNDPWGQDEKCVEGM